jgi:hypothetical protein
MKKGRKAFGHRHADETRRFECGKRSDLYLLAHDEESGALVFTEACSCALEERQFNAILEAVRQAAREEGPQAFAVRWDDEEVEYWSLGLVQ